MSSLTVSRMTYFVFFRIATLAAVIAALSQLSLTADSASAATGVINNNGVDVSDSWVRPGSPGSPGDPGSGGSSSGGTSWLGPYRPSIPWSMRSVYCVALVVTPSWCGTSQAPVEPTAPEPVIPTLTFDDLSHVEPQSPTLSTQPVGWSVINLPTNFIAAISEHVVTTVVLGRDVEVRFTPIHYDWYFGDGETNSTTSPGAPWEQLGVAEFSTTPTSHRYRTSQSVTPTVTVTYSVAYRWFGQDWISVDGTLSRDASAPIVFVQNADTVLVASLCRAGHMAPGCAMN